MKELTPLIERYKSEYKKLQFENKNTGFGIVWATRDSESKALKRVIEDLEAIQGKAIEK